MEIEARYEFRYFGRDLAGHLEKLQARSEPGEERKSEEIYLVSDQVDDRNYKIRDGKIDLKVLKRKHEDLEQWYPEFKGEFPLDGEILSEWLEPLFGAGKTLHDGESYTLEQFLEEIRRQFPGVRAVPVSKTRKHYKIAGCMAEFAEVKIDGTAVQSIAIESTDPGRVMKARKETGLQKHENMNYVKAIKRWERR